MSRGAGVGLVLTAIVLLVIGGGAYLLTAFDPIGGREANRAGPGAGGPRLNAEIVGPDAPAGPEQPPNVGTEPQPARLSPGGTVVAGSAGSVRSGGAAAPRVAPPACSVSLLQSILGLGVSLLGGRPAC